jgi:hypothetical protein
MLPGPLSPHARRPGWEAALLAIGFVGLSLAALVGLTVLVNLAGGSAAAGIAATAGMILLLSFVTLRAYPPGTKIPWLLLLLLTLLTVVIPLLYVSWLWLSGRKWAAAATAT